MLLEAVQRRRPPVTRLGRRATGPTPRISTRRTAGDPRIDWLGRVTDDEKIARLRRRDVFCAPSLHGESFGVVLIEAMAAGTTVVASALDGYRNVATDGVDACSSSRVTSTPLRRRCSSVLTRRALPGRLATRERRAEEFSMTSLADRYVEIYQQVDRPRRAIAD